VGLSRQNQDCSVFGIQQEIAGVLAAIFGTPARARRGGELVRTSTRNVEAQNLYLLGRYQWGNRNPVAISRASRAVEPALSRGSTAKALCPGRQERLRRWRFRQEN
jgi:hypothetical protein